MKMPRIWDIFDKLPTNWVKSSNHGSIRLEISLFFPAPSFLRNSSKRKVLLITEEQETN